MNLPLYFVLNKVMSEISTRMRKNLPADKIIGEIPMDQDHLAAGLTGKEISESSQAVMPVIRNIISGIKSS